MRRGRTNTSLGTELRPVCKHGTSCYRRNPDHLSEYAHPADEDYLECCEKEGIAPEFVSVRKLFDYCDGAGTGRVSKESLAKIWEVVGRLGVGVGTLEDTWEKLDEDGNGYINFSEFAEWTTSKSVGLPLGLDDLLPSARKSTKEAGLRCGVVGCDCRCFVMRRPRCKYGESCYQKNEEHRKTYLHPGDKGWEASCASSSSTVKDPNMCECGHKQKLHASSLKALHMVSYPGHWRSDASEEFNQRMPMRPEFNSLFQELLELTYLDVTTRDRVKACGTWKVPKNFVLEDVSRNENSRLWRKYMMKKHELLRESRLYTDDGSDKASTALPDFGDYSDVLTRKPYQNVVQKAIKMGIIEPGEMNEANRVDPEINEWLLFHGTSTSAAQNICEHDFTMRLAGSATGTLYGRGAYLAESITKADEYAREENGVFTVLLCRVLGGRVKYCDERTPDAEALMDECTTGVYDSILGDRRKCSGTYREFVIFDTENVYPEYIIKYKRGEFIKTPSHP